MKERTIAMLWLLAVFGFIVGAAALQLEPIIISTIGTLAGVVAGYYFARDANGGS